ncbi:AcrZ family multidrug efflux pump-associated protein [Xenorhabdus bovienii]|uniref:Multidrug efflux pump accessory protein AcrZ n=6 Tax=Xenorhabdus TaxID=626 RepID=A0A077PD52_XENBV|nr:MULTISPECIES: AcrZ family multidrug efflux pump-associated protein [Xenorhabdus]MCG3471246.1 AcrZ family multidrug efflux pump-associated protein [Xenorhabdus bovienii]MDC9620523.1 AcrZ family multidrug efflux pump-associated protein [Xenorhabdus aichiensis]MDE1487940.1 AcrZ family multidrug efflux pump-associated protein [Xenorhabdus bovienii]MDE1495980.1 AcrZ family multidrug efflux pump-associated protein [Xenorhabdus bovienii]MDE9445114.1 AcrZ family multidrug efflux pump-associated pro
MFELIGSMAFALIMVPVVMALILGLIYGLGEVFNVISKTGNTERQP